MILPSPGYCVGIFLILLVVVNGTECPAGKYSQTAGTNCKICQRSRYTNANGQSSCKWCSAGQYITDHESTQSEHAKLLHHMRSQIDEQDRIISKHRQDFLNLNTVEVVLLGSAVLLCKLHLCDEIHEIFC